MSAILTDDGRIALNGSSASIPAEKVRHVEFTRAGAAVSYMNNTIYNRVGRGKAGLTTSISGHDNKTIFKWLQKHHPDFGELSFSLRVDTIFPLSIHKGSTSVKQFFTAALLDKIKSDTTLSGIADRFAKDTGFNSHAILKVTGSDFKIA